jgi:hypothetical protein
MYSHYGRFRSITCKSNPVEEKSRHRQDNQNGNNNNNNNNNNNIQLF